MTTAGVSYRAAQEAAHELELAAVNADSPEQKQWLMEVANALHAITNDTDAIVVED